MLLCHYYAHLGRLLADAGSLIPSTSCGPRMYCNRASTRWYTMDKVTPQIIENRLNKRNFRTHQDGLERAQANS